jgi:Glycosyltransferase family 87
MAYLVAASMAAMMADVPPVFRSRRVRWVLIAASVLGLIIGLDTLILHLRLDPLADVRAYYDAGARLNAGQPLYVQSATTDDPGFYRYPPLLAIAFRPLALLPYETAAVIWEAFLIVLFVGTLVRLGVRNPWTWIVSGWLAAPIAWSLAIGQAQVAVTFLVALGAPWAIALAANLKILPIIVAVYWLGRRDWRAIRTLVVWMIALVAVQFVLEPAGTIAFLSFSDLGQVGNVNNRSLYAISPLLWAGSLVLALGLALRFAPTRAGWALAVTASVLVSPRLLTYQLSTLQAAAREGPAPAGEQDADRGRLDG